MRRALERSLAFLGRHAAPATLIVALVGAAVLVVYLAAASPRPARSEEFAAWVQAVGTIGAIIATAGVAWWVPWAASKERERGLRRTAEYYLDACAEAIASLADILVSMTDRQTRMFAQRPPSKLGYNLDHYVGMLSSFPMHELSDAELPNAFLRMQNCLTRAAKVIDAYNAAVESLASFDRAASVTSLSKVADRARQVSRDFKARSMNGRTPAPTAPAPPGAGAP